MIVKEKLIKSLSCFW